MRKTFKYIFVSLTLVVLIFFSLQILIACFDISNSGSYNRSSSSSSTSSFNKNSCISAEYEDVARTPSVYKNKNLVITGTVLQVVENGKSRVFRIADNGDYNNIWYVTYQAKTSTESRVLEYDNVTIYGICEGTKTYKSVLGQEITVPYLNGVIVENNSVQTTAAQTIESTTTSSKITDDNTNNPYDTVADNKTSEVETTQAVSSEFNAALTKAQSYSEILNYSKQQIYDQLISDFEQFPPEAAQYAIDHLDVDFRINALEKAKSYREILNYSNKAIFNQLVTIEKFTEEEAQYAIDNLG